MLQIRSGNLESGVWRYSRFILEIWSLECGYPGLQKMWSTPDSRLQISRKKTTGVPGPRTQENGLQILESGAPIIPILPILQIYSGNLESGVWGCSRFVLEIWSLGSGGTPDLFWKSGYPGPQKMWSTLDSRLQISRKKKLEYRGRGLQKTDLEIWSLGSGGTPDLFWKSGVCSKKPRVWVPRAPKNPGLQTPDFQKKKREYRSPGLQKTDSRFWSPGPRYSRFILEISSLESGVLQIRSGNLQSGVPPSQNPTSTAFPNQIVDLRVRAWDES